MSSTRVRGPQMKHSVARSCRSGSSSSGPMRPRVPIHSLRRVARHGHQQLDTAQRRQFAQLGLIGEVARRPRAVQHADVAVTTQQTLAEHGPQRRDAGAAGDEQEALLLRIGREREPSQRTLDIDLRAGFQLNVRSGVPFSIDANQQLDPPVTGCILRRSRDRVRLAWHVPMRGEQQRLPRVVRKRMAPEIDPHDARARCRGNHLPDRQRQQHGDMLSHCMSPIVRRLRGRLLRLVRRRALAMILGALLIVPAVWVELASPYEAWWIDGLALIAGATGVAIFWTGFTGAAPDWVE